jgi:hypothetical protein
LDNHRDKSKFKEEKKIQVIYFWMNNLTYISVSIFFYPLFPSDCFSSILEKELCVIPCAMFRYSNQSRRCFIVFERYSECSFEKSIG